jgi:hypothetical protein
MGFPDDRISLMHLARAPMRALVSPWRSEAWAAGRQLMADFEAYAIEIGCTVVQDSILTDEEQARKLAAWWTEKTNG